MRTPEVLGLAAVLEGRSCFILGGKVVLLDEEEEGRLLGGGTGGWYMLCGSLSPGGSRYIGG